MNLCLSGVSFLAGTGIGGLITGKVKDDGIGLQFLQAQSTMKRVAILVLHVFCAIAAVGLHFMLPQMGLPFVVTKFFQGSLLMPLICSGIEIQNHAFNLSPAVYDNMIGISVILSLTTGLFLASISSIPMVMTASTIGLSLHVYNWWKAN